VNPGRFFEELSFHSPVIYSQKTRHVWDRLSAILISNTDMESHRDQKRQSSKKNSDYGVYTKKAVRAKEALLEKKLSCPAKVKGQSK
jgi:hypothetical protein